MGQAKFTGGGSSFSKGGLSHPLPPLATSLIGPCRNYIIHLLIHFPNYSFSLSILIHYLYPLLIHYNQADGWSRTDGVAVFVLQRAYIAKRCYAVIEHALSKIYGDTPDILQKPSQHYWELMLNEFYAQSKLKPNDISYVEGDGTGIKVFSVTVLI